MRRVVDCDPSALAEVFGSYRRPVFLVIVQVVREAALAEDLVQEVFLRVWRRSNDYAADRGGLGSWINTIAYHYAIDYLRSAQGRAAHCTVTIHGVQHPALLCDANDGIRTWDSRRTILEAMLKLSAMQRQVIELAYYEGLSQSEIARSLHQPLGTVKSWTRAALRALRDEIAPSDKKPSRCNRAPNNP